MNVDTANEILKMAYKEMVRYPSLRLGQAIINAAPNGLLEVPWPELFHEECPVEASTLFYARVDSNGKRESTGSVDMSFMYPR